MSALAGIWNFDGRPDADRACADMLAAQAIYGPHDEAQSDLGAISLGRRLFRILPEDIHDQQPVSGGAGRFTLAADIRLDNRDELIAALQVPEARNLADSAILMAAWERWGEATFDRLVGDYAFALFDKTEQKLVLARDPLGMRPLHYHRGKTFFAFASMPKGLHRLPEIPRLPDEEHVAEQLALLPEGGSQSYFKNVERVQAGHFVSVTTAGLSSQRHWNPQRKTLKLANAEEYAEAMRHHFDAAVRSCLRGAGDAVGSHLSSGFDSSAVATAAAIQMAPRGKVVAFTSVPREGFKGKTPRLRHGDEGPIAALTAAKYPNIEHVLIRTLGRSPLDGLDRNFFLYERPLLNLCNGVWLHAINDAAKARKLNVVLTGQMGNMSISYDGLTLLPQLVANGRFLHWTREGATLVRSGHMRIRNVMAQSFGPYMPLPMWKAINRVFRGVTSGIETYSAIRPERIRDLDLPAKARARGLDLDYRPRKDGFEARLWVLNRVDMGNYNKGTLAGWGFDQRDPTADRRLLEFCLSVPEEQFLAGGQTKALARRAFAARMPAEVVNMRGKGYQAADWYESMAPAGGQIAEEVARLTECGPAAAAIDLPRLQTLLDEWPSQGWESEAVLRKYRLAMLRGISSGHFLRKASGSNA